MNKKDGEYRFCGIATRKIFWSNDFGVYAFNVSEQDYPDIKQSKYGNVSVVGNIHELSIGMKYEVIANEKSDKYGISYDVISIKQDVPMTSEETKRFLLSILNTSQAEELYRHYPNIVKKVMDDNYNDIDLSKLHGIGEKTFAKIVEKIKDEFCLSEFVVKFGGLISLKMLRKISKVYNSATLLEEKIIEEPYRTLTRVSGVGFKIADEIIKKMHEENVVDFGCDIVKSKDRCFACIMYLLEKNEEDGHTKDNIIELRKKCFEFAPECAEHFTEAIKCDEIYYDKETFSISLKKTYIRERYIAETILEGIKNNNNVWHCDIEKYRYAGDVSLTNEQLKVVKSICKNQISILQGSAGVGKSQSTKAVIRMLDDKNKKYKLLAPTGKAAKVLADFTGRPASTIHRGLCYNPQRLGKNNKPDPWGYNRDKKLPHDIVIVDEMSMVDVNLFYHLIEAIDFTKTKLLMIGDSAQLPSVGCGNLLHDFIHSGIIPVVTLHKVFRYGEGGLMKCATDTRLCKPYLNKSMTKKTTIFGSNKDYVFFDTESEFAVQKVISIYKKLIDKGEAVEDIQVLTSKNIGKHGTNILNSMLQKIANKNCKYNLDYIDIEDTRFYKGDIVVQYKNEYKAKLLDIEETTFIANGESGVIIDIKNGHAIIDFGNDIVDYSKEFMNNVKLGYAMTIHKSQGSSIKNVILLTPKSDIYMMNSNLLYVGMTRMKNRCYHVGDIKAVNIAIKKKEDKNRKTFMLGLLKGINLN